MTGKRAQARAETRDKLVRAARKAFAQQGYTAASMDDLTAAAGLTRGALYHNFGDKKGLLWAVVEQLDSEMAVNLIKAREGAVDRRQGLIEEGVAYIEMALDPEIQRIVLLDGPSVLGDPSKWPSEIACLEVTRSTIQSLLDDGTVAGLDADATARLLNGAALNAALWVAASDHPKAALPKATKAYRRLVAGLLG